MILGWVISYTIVMQRSWGTSDLFCKLANITIAKFQKVKGCGHARAHGSRAMNGGRQVHYFFFGITASTSLCSNGLQGLTRARTQKFPCLFFFSMFFLSQFRLHLFFCQILGLFAQSGLRENSKVNMQKRSRIFWQLFSVVVEVFQSVVCKFTNIFLIDKFFFHIFPFFYEEQGIFFFVVSK